MIGQDLSRPTSYFWTLMETLAEKALQKNMHTLLNSSVRMSIFRGGFGGFKLPEMNLLLLQKPKIFSGKPPEIQHLPQNLFWLHPSQLTDLILLQTFILHLFKRDYSEVLTTPVWPNNIVTFTDRI